MKEPRILLPFRIELRSGEPISNQLVYAVEKAVITGLLKPNSRFPSIRALSQELRIHPNTAQKAVTTLIDEGFLEVNPGIGTMVAKSIPMIGRNAKLMDRETEHLVLQAKRMRLSLADLQQILANHWQQLTND